MSRSQMIKQILGLPSEYVRLGDVTMISLLREAGFYDTVDEITQAEILEVLRGFPNHFQEWQQYSEDQRCDGWFLLNREDGQYLVAYTSSGIHSNQEIFKDSLEACSSYIKKELDYFRKTYPSGAGF